MFASINKVANTFPFGCKKLYASMSAKELNVTNINNQSNNAYEDKGRKTTEAIIIKHKNCQT